MQLIRMVHDELARLSAFVRNPCVRRNDLGLTGDGRYLVVIFLYGRQVRGLPRNKVVLRLILTQDLGKLFGDVGD